MKDDRELALEILQDAEQKLSALWDYEPFRPLAPIMHLMDSALDSLRVSIKCHYNGGYNQFQ